MEMGILLGERSHISLGGSYTWTQQLQVYQLKRRQALQIENTSKNTEALEDAAQALSLVWAPDCSGPCMPY